MDPNSLKLPKTSDNKLITNYHHRACELYFDGKSPEIIAEMLFAEFGIKYTDRWVRHWFTEHHWLRKYYDTYAAIEIERRQKFTRDLFEANVDKAAGTLMKAMAGLAGAPAVTAAKEWLERGIGKMPEKINLDHRLGIHTIADLIASEEDDDEEEVRENMESEPGGISKDLLA